MIDADRLIAKATKDDPTKLSDIVKGALRPDQIDDMRLMLSRAQDGSVVHGAATTSAAASVPAASAAAGPRDTSVQRRAWKGGANKASAKFQGIPPTSEPSLTAASEYPPLSAAITIWSVRTVNWVPSRPCASRRAETPHPTIFATDAEVAMTHREKALHETQVSPGRYELAVPDSEKPPGALSGPGHGKGKGVGKQTHAARAVEDAYGPGPIMDEINDL